MAELATNEIVKIVIAVLVLTIVIFGVIVGYRNYIVPYFSDLGPSEKGIDLSTPYYQALLKDENVVGLLIANNGKNFISIKKGSGEKGDFVKTSFYYNKKNGEIRKHFSFSLFSPSTWKDSLAGRVEKDGRIFIDQLYLNELGEINGGEVIGDEIRKIGASK